MRLKKSTANKLLISTAILVLLGQVIIDFWPLPLRSLWARYPKLDTLRLVTKPIDALYFPWLLPATKLPHYNINIKPTDQDKLLSSLPDAYTFTIYDRSQQVFVPATFVAEDTAYPVKVRIHGDLYHHWSGSKKSLRVRFTEASFKDYTELSFILPETRGFVDESLGAFRAKKMDLITLDDWFATVEINGKSQGLYLVQEHWTAGALEKNRRTSDADLFGELDLVGVWDWPQLFSRLDSWKKYTQNPLAPADYAAINKLLDLFDDSDSEEIFQKAASIIDLDSFAKWQAHAMLFPSFHQNSDHNMRLYFNRELGLFEFVPYDIELGKPTRGFDKENYNQLVSLLLSDPKIKAMRDQALIDYTSNENNLKDDLAYFDGMIDQIRSAVAKDKKKAYSTLFFSSQIALHRANITRQFQLIRESFL